MDKKLYLILKPYDNWFNDEGERRNQEAKKALLIFYNELIKYKPSKVYEKKDLFHTSYINFLLEIKKAFVEEKYMRACNELISLMHYEPFFQGRIYFNVLNLLKDGLDIGGI